MSVQKMWEVGLNILEIPLLITAVVILAKKTGRRRGLFAAFFMFAMIALALEDIYWITYDFLRPDTWMPLAADEFAGSAAILLLGSALSKKVAESVKITIPEAVFAVLFMAGCAGIWIGWSGEWIQNIVFTVPYVYFLFVLLRGMRSTGALNSAEKSLAVFFCVIDIVLAGMFFVLSGETANVIDKVDQGILSGVTVLFLIKVIYEKRRECSTEKLLCLSFALYLWSRLAIYMSNGLFYNVAQFLHMLTIPIMLYAVLLDPDVQVMPDHKADTDPGRTEAEKEA